MTEQMKERLMVTDGQRRKLFESLVHELGEDSAETLMAMLPPMDWSDVARRSDQAELRVELRGEFAELRGEMAELRGEVGALGGDVRALGSRLDAQFAKLVAANLFTSAALAAMIGAAVRLFGA